MQKCVYVSNEEACVSKLHLLKDQYYYMSRTIPENKAFHSFTNNNIPKYNLDHKSYLGML